MNKRFDKETFKRSVVDNVKDVFRKTTGGVTSQQIFQAVVYAAKDAIIDEWIATRKEYERKDVKTVYYLSMEFLMGRAPGDNIIDICARDEIKETLDGMGFDLNVIGDQEPDAALRNDGPGCLAACFLDSLITLGCPAYSRDIHYRYDTFKQKIENSYRVEVPDNQLKDDSPFEIRRPEYASRTKFGGYVRIENQGGVNHFVQGGYQSVRAAPYDLPTIGYGNNVVDTLHTWDAEPVNAFNLDSFDRGDYQKTVEQEDLAKTIAGVLYPNDNHYAGKEPYLKRQYFFTSASVQRAVKKYKEKYDDIRKFYEKVMFQLNSIHPAVAIPESMRIFLDEEGSAWDEAQKVTARTCAYISHTIISEALERWPIELLSRLLPRIYRIMEEINRRFQSQIQTMYPGNQEKLRKIPIIYDGQMKMAYMAIAASFSVDGAARLHTEILKHQGLKNFYEMMPGRSNNKANGVTQRWFLPRGNPLLTDWVTSEIDNEWITDLSHIKKLEFFAGDEKCQLESMNIKYQNKLRLVRHTEENNDIDMDPRSTLDVQVKRFHEYERQLMNIFHVMYLYNQLKDDPDMDVIPRASIFDIKVAAGYKRAELTTKLINSVVDAINNDKPVNGRIEVVPIEGHRVSNAELIFAAADAGEQVSTISKEASGASNMKFTLNGALTLGTADGANVEIVEEVEANNAFIFGMSSDEVINYENSGGHYPMDIFNNDQEARRVPMQLINGYYAPDNSELFRGVYNSLLNTKNSDRADTYLILKDFRSYVEAHQRVDKAHRDQARQAKAAILSTVNYGKPTSDRTIEEYVKNI